MISPTSRRYLIMFLSLTCFASVTPAGGQGAAPKDTTASLALKARPWALQLHVPSLGGPMNLMLKRRLSPKTSLRLDININAKVSASTSGYQPNDTRVDDNTSGSYGIAFGIHYIRHLTPGSDFKWYIGAGPYSAYAADERQNERIWERTYPDSATFEHNDDNSSRGSSWTAGGLAFAGTEWFISDRVSFAVEYGLRGQYRWRRGINTLQKTKTNLDTGEIVSDSSSKDEDGSGTWSASSGSAKLVLAIHF